jgi:uncharacterized damage-inducible protein DinB
MDAKKGLALVHRQTTEILAQISAEDFTTPLELFNGATLGQHFRHILDFFQCLAQAAVSGIVDYARRQRDPLPEKDPQTAALLFQQVLDEIGKMQENSPLLMRADFMGTAEADRPLYASSAGREMTFVHDHAIHHMAMIQMGIREYFPYIVRSEHFGVAPSTVKFRMEKE